MENVFIVVQNTFCDSASASSLFLISIFHQTSGSCSFDNNYGKQRKCHCGEKETTEHIQCKQVEKERLKKEWLEETVDIGIIRTVNRWLEEYIEEGDKNK